MPSDIRLEDEVLILEGNTRVDVIASDLVLDQPLRRSDPNGFRRALVHNADDGLTINFNGDYPADVSVGSSMKIEGVLRVRNIIFEDRPVPPRGTTPGIEVDLGMGVSLHPGLFDPGIAERAFKPEPGIDPSVFIPFEEMHLRQQIEWLHQTVEVLQARLDALESRGPS